MESKDKLIYIYGVNPVKEAFKVPHGLKEIYVWRKRLNKLQEIVTTAESLSIPVKIVDEDFIERHSDGVHQGILAKIRPKNTISIQQALKLSEEKKEPPFFLIVDLIEDPQNFGSILRVADAAGIHAVIYQQKRSVGLTPSVWKASSGAVWHVNLVEINNIKYAIREFKQQGIKIVGAEAFADRVFWEADFKKPIALIVGSESKGIRPTVKSLCDEIVQIPMYGKLNSLNVSAATAILVFEALRQRKYGSVF